MADRGRLGIFSLIMGYFYPWCMPGVERIKLLGRYTPKQVQDIRMQNIQLLKPYIHVYEARWLRIFVVVASTTLITYLLGIEFMLIVMVHLLFISAASYFAVRRMRHLVVRLCDLSEKNDR